RGFTWNWRASHDPYRRDGACGLAPVEVQWRASQYRQLVWRRHRPFMGWMVTTVTCRWRPIVNLPYPFHVKRRAHSFRPTGTEAGVGAVLCATVVRCSQGFESRLSELRMSAWDAIAWP